MRRGAGSREHGWRDWRLGAALSSGGLTWCIAAGVLIWVLPWGSSVTTSSEGVSTTESQSFSSISSFGPLPLLVPVALAGLATWASFRHHRAVLIGATAVLALYALLAGFSIGFAYVPAVLALVLACAATSRTSQRSGREQG